MRPIVSRTAIVAVALIGSASLVSWSTTTAAAPPASNTETATAAAPARHSSHDPGVTIYLTRHGRTLLNQTDTVQGWSDSPLLIGTKEFATAPVTNNDAGRPLARAVGKNLRAAVGKMDVAYSADGKRHFETATYMLQGAGQKLDVTQDARLREVNFGKYEGKENKEMWTAAVEHLGYTIDHDAPGTAPADANGQNGGWQTMQGIAINERGLYAMMVAIKAVANDPANQLPAEDCTDTYNRMDESLRAIAKRATKKHDDKVLVVSSGLSISCFVGNDSIKTTTGGTPVLPATGISNVAVTKLIYSKGTFTVSGTVGDKSYYPQP